MLFSCSRSSSISSSTRWRRWPRALRTGAITVRTESTEAETVHVSVQDAGPGLGEGTQDLIFEPFYSTKPSGVGMGLAISKSIIEPHGGRIWATDNATAGAIFHFWLPLAARRSRLSTTE
jgi:signal transduction histidine kinase